MTLHTRSDGPTACSVCSAEESYPFVRFDARIVICWDCLRRAWAMAKPASLHERTPVEAK
jgi:hypothetical protein